MSRVFKQLVIFVLCMVVLSCPQSKAKLSLEEQITNCVSSYIKKWNYSPGISVSVYGQLGKVNYNYATGYSSLSNKTKNNIYTQHFIYSITKSFIAASIIKLSNENKLSLSDPISNYLQDLDTRYINVDATIDELLTHRSGINDYTESSSIIHSNPFSNTDEWNAETILSIIETPATNRGEFVYSSANYIILGMIIEKVSSTTLNNYLKECFINILNLDINIYPQDNVNLENIAHPHCYPYTFIGLVGDGETPIDITTILTNALELLGKCSWAAGGIISNAKDIANWGYNLLSALGCIDTQIKNKIIDSVSEFVDSSLVSVAYGYGIRKLFNDGDELIGSYGRSIGDENLMFYDKQNDICIVIFSSSNMREDKTPNIDELMYEIQACFKK